jgi:predicted O-methyltransferase YrrM
MSVTPTLITEDIAKYIVNNFSAEDEFLKNLREESLREGFPEICISPEQGLFLQFFLTSINAKYVLEVGGLAGYSAIMMARAMPDDGKLITVELNQDYVDFINRKAKEAKLDHIIEAVCDDGKDFLADYEADFEFDFVFVDADKPSYSIYLDLATPKLRKGGVFAADNALAFGDIAVPNPQREPHNVKAIVEFNEYFNHHEQYKTCLVSVGDGMVMGTKLY